MIQDNHVIEKWRLLKTHFHLCIVKSENGDIETEATG